MCRVQAKASPTCGASTRLLQVCCAPRRTAPHRTMFLQCDLVVVFHIPRMCITGKPLFITEFGVDSYVAGFSTADMELQQATWDLTMWNEIQGFKLNSPLTTPFVMSSNFLLSYFSV